jgi:hypothetical protein
VARWISQLHRWHSETPGSLHSLLSKSAKPGASDVVAYGWPVYLRERLSGRYAPSYLQGACQMSPYQDHLYDVLNGTYPDPGCAYCREWITRAAAKEQANEYPHPHGVTFIDDLRDSDAD